MFERFPIPDLQGTYLETLAAGSGSYPASRIQKGLVLGLNDRDLSEEGVGFGVPVLKFGLESVFPDSWRMSAENHDGFFLINADFRMNLVARMAKNNDIINNHVFCWAREKLSKIHREDSRLRGGMSFLSGILRRTFDLKDTFCKIPTLGFVAVTYMIIGSRIDVELKFPLVNGCTELIVLNEQGASCFDTYVDTDSRILMGKEIGSWDEANAKYASFIDSFDKLSFTLRSVEGAKMFRGREMATDRLSWSGLAYILPPQREKFAYSIRIGRL